MIVVAVVTPLAVLFSVSPSEFEPTDCVNLTATILYASDGSAFTGYNVNVTFYNVSSDGTNSSHLIVSNTNGVASWNNVQYPNDGKAHAFMAKIVPEYAGLVLPQGIASNPVQLTVSKSTRILLNITKEDSSTNHLIEGWLMWKNGGVSGKTIKLKVNETDYALTTGSNGYFSLTLNLQPQGNSTAYYIITATFEDEAIQPINATAWAYTLDGQCYAACTTIQYGYKPSSNMTTLTVDPRATELMRLAKSPEEMQQEAQNKGWVRVEPEFSWWYPWFRLHFKLNVNLPQGNPNIDHGWAILPFGESYAANDMTVANIMNDAANEGDPWAILDFMTGSIIQVGIYLAIGRTITGIIAAIALYSMYTAIRTIQLLFSSAGNSRAWLIAFISTLIGVSGTMALGGIFKVGRFLTSTSRWILGQVHSLVNSMHAFELNFFDITGLAFAFIDFGLMAFYLNMYLASI